MRKYLYNNIETLLMITFPLKRIKTCFKKDVLINHDFDTKMK